MVCVMWATPGSRRSRQALHGWPCRLDRQASPRYVGAFHARDRSCLTTHAVDQVPIAVKVGLALDGHANLARDPLRWLVDRPDQGNHAIQAHRAERVIAHTTPGLGRKSAAPVAPVSEPTDLRLSLAVNILQGQADLAHSLA